MTIPPAPATIRRIGGKREMIRRIENRCHLKMARHNAENYRLSSMHQSAPFLAKNDAHQSVGRVRIGSICL